jgi:hypothetical protein
MTTQEGSAVISDADGNPLFYTNGIDIWDASDDTQFNTTQMEGGGSSTQSAIIVPKPGTTDEWLVFTSNMDPGSAGTGADDGIEYYTVSGSPGAFTLSAKTDLAGAGTVGEGLAIIGNTNAGDAY